MLYNNIANRMNKVMILSRLFTLIYFRLILFTFISTSGTNIRFIGAYIRKKCKNNTGTDQRFIKKDILNKSQGRFFNNF